MAKARKLFPSYGSAVAQAFCHALEREGMVRAFIMGYSREFDRKAVAATSAQLHEMETTIGREALLAMTIEAREQLPRFFGKRRGEEKLDEQQALASDAFFDQFISALGRVKSWTPDEMSEFLRDLDLYVRMGPQHAPARGKARTKSATKREPMPERFPFPDRCALILDPSMMEKARRAADRFHAELARASGKILARTLGMRASR
jgi:hypothetical protein